MKGHERHDKIADRGMERQLRRIADDHRLTNHMGRRGPHHSERGVDGDDAVSPGHQIPSDPPLAGTDVDRQVTGRG